MCEAVNEQCIQHFSVSLYEKCGKGLLQSVLIFVQSQTWHVQDFGVLEQNSFGFAFQYITQIIVPVSVIVTVQLTNHCGLSSL